MRFIAIQTLVAEEAGRDHVIVITGIPGELCTACTLVCGYTCEVGPEPNLLQKLLVFFFATILLKLAYFDR